MRALALLALLLLSWTLPGSAWANPINVNTADESSLDTLPGIGPSKARAIIEHRDKNGPFASLDDLDAVSGIGPATLANIQSMVIFSDGGTPAAAAPSTTSASSASSGGGQVDINEAAAEQLESMPGIGPSKAQAIIEHRDKNGPFASCADLSIVTGIGDATVANISAVCVVR